MATRQLKIGEQAKQLNKILQDAETRATGEEDVHVLVDVGYELNEIKRVCESLLDGIKTSIKNHAEEHKIKQVNGESGRTVAKISPATSTVISPKGALKVIRKMDRLDMFDAVFSVKVTDFKKYFGEPSKEIATVSKKEYGSISFKDKR